MFVCILSCAAGAVVNNSCRNEKTAQPQTGEELAALHCGSCHLPVKPEMLDSATWVNGVLPSMARKMGIGVLFETEYYQDTGTVISLESWMKIVKYFKETAPKQLSRPVPAVPISKNDAIFSVLKPQTAQAEHAATTMIAFNPYDRRIYTGNVFGKIQAWNSKLEPLFSKKAPSAVVAASFSKKNSGQAIGSFTCIGSISPSDISTGMLTCITLHPDSADEGALFTGLPRPVQSVPADFNGDGLQDWLICGFGHNEGELMLFTQTSDGGYTKKILVPGSGALQVSINDFNKDGSPDLMALFANANERIELMLNDGKANFSRKVLLQFSPLAGSTSFLPEDVDHDGLEDIIYTSGDNADVSKTLKPYHGVYIYLNKGDFQYQQAWFYPVNGCYKVVAADFDKDGDKDLATIAYFADFKNNPSESFLYFEQTGLLSFTPYSPAIETFGRWACMDAGDIDGDGDDDILLGNHSNGAEPEMQTNAVNSVQYKQQPFLVLKNNLVKKR